MLTGQKCEAALLVAERRLSYAKIAEKVGVSDRTIDNWCIEPEFKAEVDKHRKNWQVACERYSIASVLNRVAEAEELRRRLLTAINRRARKAEKEGIKEAVGGLVAWRTKSLKTGKDTWVETTEFEIDTAPVRAITDLHEHVATELGQWKQKIEHSGEVVQPIAIQNLSLLSDDELSQLITITRKLQPAGSGEGVPEEGTERDRPILPGDGPEAA